LKFDVVISDIIRLVGLNLNSIKVGANISITSVDVDNQRVFLTDASGNNKSRPFDELRRIWDCLCTDEVAHVDSVLSGSGSSRNQPETILANLPYVEWLTISNKKHLRYVGKNTHPLGTLKQMDSVVVHQLKEKLKNSSTLFPTSILVVNSLKSYATWIETLTGVSPTVVVSGVYRVDQMGSEVWFTTPSDTNAKLNIGNYPVIRILNMPTISTEILLAGKKFFLVSREEKNYLLYVR
jgi:hypothetical protein